jgi:prevent-host-death family protein
MEYTVYQAQKNFARLLTEASIGKEVIIVRGGKPLAKLVPIPAPHSQREPGRFAGQITYTTDAFEPLTRRELRDLGFRR